MADGTFKIGDRVRYTAATQGTNARRHDGIGTVSEEPFKTPFGWYVITVTFEDGTIVQGTREEHLELVPLNPRAEMAGNANSGETPLPLRVMQASEPEIEHSFQIGDRVQITQGGIAGSIGRISSVRAQRVDIVLDVSGTTALDISVNDIELIKTVTANFKVGDRVRFRREHEHEYPRYAGRVFTITEVNEEGVTIAFGGRTEVVPSIPAYMLEIVRDNPSALGAANADHTILAGESTIVPATIQPGVPRDALPTGTGLGTGAAPENWDPYDVFETDSDRYSSHDVGRIADYPPVDRPISPEIQAVVGAINGLRGELVAIRRLFEESRATGPGAGHNNPPTDDVLMLTEQMVIAADDIATGLQKEVQQGTPKSDNARRDAKGLDIFGTLLKGILQEAGKGTGKVLTDQALKAGGEEILRALMTKAIGWISTIVQLVKSW